MPVSNSTAAPRNLPAFEANPAPASAAATLLPMCRFVRGDTLRILEHLLALNADDRFLRFSHAIRDDGMANYVAALDFKRDHLHGLCNANGDILALAHVATRDGEADFGLSVLASARGYGFGRALFQHAIALARSHGANRIVCHSISPAVLHMADGCGFRRASGRITEPPMLDLRTSKPQGRNDNGA